MKIKRWKSKMGAMLITGLVVSSVPVLAFAEQGKEEIVAEASELQEKDTQADSGTNKENDSETEIKTELVSEEEEKKIVTENPEEKEKDVEDDTEKDEAIDTESENDEEHGSENETGTETEPDSEIDSDTEEKTETEGKAPEETEQLELEILPEEIQEELLPEVELATPSNLPMPKEEGIDEQLLGTWAADEYTSLRFDEDGQGSMILPESEYEFRYVLENDKLTLDFASSRAKDVAYVVSVYDDSMKMTGGLETMNQEIILERVE